MSKVIYVCARNGLSPKVAERLTNICGALAPDNIDPEQPEVAVAENSAYAVANPSGLVSGHGRSLMLGLVCKGAENWQSPLSVLPEGSFCLIRADDDHLEIASDAVGSYGLWYYFDKEIFLVSNSQRAIVMYLGSFEFNEAVIPWMLSSGSLGPYLSWDSRIKLLPPDSSAQLDRRAWSLTQNVNPVDFEVAEGLSDEEHEQRMRRALEDVFSSMDPDFARCKLPLSGGYDSRGLLCLFREFNPGWREIKTITWGLSSSLEDPENDAFIARRLAEEVGVAHKYYSLDLKERSARSVLERFVGLGEGRIDHIAGYTDGFKAFKTLNEDGTRGLIRGDHCFGFKSFNEMTPARIRMRNGCPMCKDFTNLKNYRSYGLVEQVLAPELEQKAGETPETWRDRLYQQYRHPMVMSALTDLKLAYLGVMNPFLSRTVVHRIRESPDHLRTNKVLFKKIVDSLSPSLDIAKRPATVTAEGVFKRPEMVEIIRDELSSANAADVLPADLLTRILGGCNARPVQEQSGSRGLNMRKLARRIVPPSVRKAMTKGEPPMSVPPGVLAFRAFLVSRMNGLLHEDAKRNARRI